MSINEIRVNKPHDATHYHQCGGLFWTKEVRGIYYWWCIFTRTWYEDHSISLEDLVSISKELD